MHPHKTEKAHSALRDRPADVSVLERRILILSDGRREDAEIADLLGAQARDAIARLLRDGYLSDRDVAQTAPAAFIASIAPASVVAAPPEALPARAATAAASSRRSIAAAKMYAVDMLQLQRGPEAAAIAAAIRGCRDQDELAAHMLRALRFIHSVANPSLSRRVADRLAEIMPEQYLAELDVFRDALFGDRTVAA
ncbi:hypothetical protein M2650_08555 [Luteimonas sp. SX5]|uniref:Uncharacterized protein n=1 Tax=Luteimonas galliterrae TaxID=2940486 RepID=A0ABT0MJ92_9GAMM|nr:hypothetical protein [Luteimonas galliterrae]MCL1634678.1 hypothetical protein [Luteimonas galliterrae]